MTAPRCTATESGGVRCELDSGHEPTGGHWISPETIQAHLYHRVTLIDPSAFTAGRDTLTRRKLALHDVGS